MFLCQGILSTFQVIILKTLLMTERFQTDAAKRATPNARGYASKALYILRLFRRIIASGSPIPIAMAKHSNGTQRPRVISIATNALVSYVYGRERAILVDTWSNKVPTERIKQATTSMVVSRPSLMLVFA